jgi:hypothetical protein
MYMVSSRLLESILNLMISRINIWAVLGEVYFPWLLLNPIIYDAVSAQGVAEASFCCQIYTKVQRRKLKFNIVIWGTFHTVSAVTVSKNIWTDIQSIPRTSKILQSRLWSFSGCVWNVAITGLWVLDREVHKDSGTASCESDSCRNNYTDGVDIFKVYYPEGKHHLHSVTDIFMFLYMYVI